jgi:hypothetical protein
MSIIKTDVLSVGPGALDSSLPIKLTSGSSVPEIWDALKAYTAYNLVEQAGDLYRARINTTAGDNPVSVPVKWEKLYESVADGDVVILTNGTVDMLQRIGGVWVSMVGRAVHKTLVDGQLTFADAILAPLSTFRVLKVIATFKRGTGGSRMRRSEFAILSDGTNVETSETFAEIGSDIQVTTQVVVSGGQIRLQYTSVNEGVDLSVDYSFQGYV